MGPVKLKNEESPRSFPALGMPGLLTNEELKLEFPRGW